MQTLVRFTHSATGLRTLLDEAKRDIRSGKLRVEQESYTLMVEGHLIQLSHVPVRQHHDMDGSYIVFVAIKEL